MSLFGLFSSAKKSETVLIVSIGSATVATAFISIDKGVTKVNGISTADISVLSDLTLERFEKEMEKALRKALAGLSKFRTHAPDRVTVFFSSPWYASQVRVAKMSRPQPFVVTKTLINDMIARELKAFEDEEITAKSGNTKPLRAIESKVIQVKLNGYATTDPINLSATEMEISIFLSVAEEATLVHVEDILQSQYHKPITFSTFLSASFIVTRDFFPHQNDYLLVDIGGEVTDITLVRDFALVQSISIPFGRNYVLRKLASALRRSVPEAISLCNLYMEDKVESSMKEACTKIFEDIKTGWLDAFQKALFSVSNELSLPDTVFVSVNPDVESWFIDTIRKEKFNQYALTEKEFKVAVLNSAVFHGHLEWKDDVPRNSCIIIEALACSRLAEHARPLGESKDREKSKK
ncbi:MAG: hypothetical protein KA052_03040 [Candidatus Pacebacteria bacterium]|nr:hypothetical protein [Candidatus Paceibacterota bacterium]